jgi:hypothetical protein
MDENPAPTSGSFARRWLGGFGSVEAVLAGALAALFNAGLLGLPGFAVLGAMAGLTVGYASRACVDIVYAYVDPRVRFA